jgi:hypothetical protein
MTVLSHVLPTVTVRMFVIAAGILAQTPTDAHESRPDFTGTWTLNRSASDDSSTLINRMHGGADGGGHTPPSGGHRMFGGGSSGRAPLTHEQIQARLALLEPPRKLTIIHSDRSITLTDGDGRSQTLTLDNQKQRLSIGTQMADVKAKWDDERLVKQVSLDDGAKVTETYSLNTQPRQLRVMVKFEAPQVPSPIVLGRVYDAESPR